MTRSILTTRSTWALCVLLLFGSAAMAQEFRAFWVDTWGNGILNQSQVDALLGVPGNPNSRGTIREANCNAVVVQVRRRADVCYPSGMGEPYFSGLTPSNFNALQAVLNAAHDTTGGKQRIEVHCWIVAFATGGGTVYSKHNNPNDLDNYWVTLDNNGNETDDKALDPGHPKCLQYLTDVCMDLVTNFDIDGLHYDYIRFTANNQGYNPVSVARYNARYGLTGKPSPSNEQFKQWRRDQVTAFVRKVYANVQAVKPQVKVSAAVVTWNPSPTASTRQAFMNTRAYYDVYSDWDAWMQEGILDMSMPMTYYNQASLPNDYQRWMNFQKDRKFNRHNIVGPGIYLNSLSNAILQLQKTREATPSGNYAQGFCGYSYRVPYSGGSWASFAPSLVSQVTPTPTTIPEMPWKTAPTKGHMMGTVTYATSGEWADGATATITGPENRTLICDGTGFYAFIDLTPGTYTVTISKSGYPNVADTVTVTAGNMSQRNFQLGTPSAPTISNVAADPQDTSATITWTTDQAATSQVEYGLTTAYGTLTPLDSNLVTNHSVTLTNLQPATTYHYRVISTNAYGNRTSGDFTFTTAAAVVVSNVQVSPTAFNATVTWQTSSPADSLVRYGPTSSYTDTVSAAALVTSHSITLSNLQPNTTYHYQVVSANAAGSSQTADATFTTPAILNEIIIDNLDPGWANTSPGGASWSSGNVEAVPKIGTNYLYTAGVNTTEANATRKCVWTPNLSVAGRYDVYAFYQKGTNRNPAAYYKVVYDGGSLVSIQNQYSDIANQGGWFLLGEDLPFQAGTAGYVQLSNNSTSTSLVSADAVKFVRRPDTTPPLTPVVNDGDWTSSRTSLSASWSSSDPETSIKRSEYRILAENGQVIRGWTDVGIQTQVTASGLSLGIGKTYRFEVRTTNHDNLVSNVGSSDGVIIFTLDATGDQHVTVEDLTIFEGCMNGPSVPYPTDAGMDCIRFDLDFDNDVDGDDFGVFQRCITGPAEPVDPTCVKQ
ncbi:MAG TPA: family 10 glycosylhydrolase [Phycisphaerae bacterium]|nr:family 10 glycosylhydrolase [Phycisphaerae bacterium]